MKKLTSRDTSRTETIDWDHAWDKATEGMACEQIEPGFKNAEEVAKEKGLSMSQTYNLLRQGAKKGLFEVRKCRPPGGRLPVTYYRPVVK